MSEITREQAKKVEDMQKDLIKDYLEKRCKTDKVLAEKYNSGKKTINGAYKFLEHEISETIKNKSGNMVKITENEWVYENVVHYFLEDSLDYEPKKVETKKTDKKQENDMFEEDIVESKPKKQSKKETEKVSIFDMFEEEDSEEDTESDMFEED